MTLALVVIGTVQAVILMVQGVLFTLTLRVMSGLEGVQHDLADLRVDIAKIGQKLDDHVVDPRAHAA